MDTLERLGYTTRAMEKYFATDERPLEMCLADVGQCDLYIGIFGWRYGYIPRTGNPDQRSITEREFREALRLGIPCLIFFTKGSASTNPANEPKELKRITRLRAELQEGWNPGYFDTPEQLGVEIVVAVSKWAKNPDLSRYLSDLVREFAELPELPNRTRNLALQDIAPINVELASAGFEQSQENASKLRTVGLLQAVQEERTLILAGEAGQGKTTALRFLAHSFAERWLAASDRRGLAEEAVESLVIPVYLSAHGPGVSLRERICQAMQRQTFHCHQEIVDGWLRQKSFLILIDGIRDVDIPVLGEEVSNLLRIAPMTRIVVANRSVLFLDKWSWPQARLLPLTEFAVRKLLKVLLGADRGSELCNTLIQNYSLEAFRRPLFTRLLALGSPTLFEKQRLTVGEVFRDVLERRFLGSWESRPASKSEEALVRDALALLAFTMVKAGRHAVSREQALVLAYKAGRRHAIRLDAQGAEALYSKIVKHGLLEQGDEELRFWHGTFRDYFAAIWLKNNGSKSGIYLRSFSTHWHDTLIMFFGLLTGEQLSTQIKLQMLGLRAMMHIVRGASFGALAWQLCILPELVMPSARLIHRFFFLLRTLGQVGFEHSEAKVKFIDALPNDWSYFQSSWIHSPVAYAMAPSRKQRDLCDPGRYICDLIGQLRVPAAFEYLNSVDLDFDRVIPGLMHNLTDELVEHMVVYISAEVSNQEGWVSPRSGYQGELVVSRLILNSRDSRFLQNVANLLKIGTAEAKHRVLDSLRSSILCFRDSDGPDWKAELEQRWTGLLTEVVLKDPEQRVRDSAKSLLEHLASSGRRFPQEAHSSLAKALQDPDPETRQRALNAFPDFGFTDQKLLWSLLDDQEIGIVLGALHHLNFNNWNNKQRYCCGVVRVLKRHRKMNSSFAQMSSDVTAHLKSEYPQPRLSRRCLGLLMATVLCPLHPGLQFYSVRALGELGLDLAVPLFIEIFRSELWVQTRREALRSLINMRKNEAKPLILEGLGDPDADIRLLSAAACDSDYLDKEFRQVVGPILLRLLNDPDKNVQLHAAGSLRRLGFLSGN